MNRRQLLIKGDIYKNIAEIVRHHHEHYNGAGYPNGLKGSEIPILSQIMTVADAFDAMTTNRIYKSRKSVKDAIVELNDLSQKQFNPKIVKAASKALKNIKVETTITQRPKTKIEKERFSYFYRDQVCGVYNTSYLELVLTYNHTDEFDVKCINVINLHNFNQYNQQNSWTKGDRLLKKFAQRLLKINTSDFVFRIHGDDFVIINKTHFTLDDKLSSLEEILEDTGIYITYKHFDIEEDDIKNTNDLEKLLQV